MGKPANARIPQPPPKKIKLQDLIIREKSQKTKRMPEEKVRQDIYRGKKNVKFLRAGQLIATLKKKIPSNP